MSRIGKKVIPLPTDVIVEIKDQDVTIKGPKGELQLTLDSRVTVEKKKVDEKQILQVVAKDTEADKAIWGTMRALLMNMITGVTSGWSKSLELNGVGFRMNLAGATLKMQLGFSHEVTYEIPESITVSVEGNVLNISGADRQTVGKVAAEIRALKKPEPYKGKGFRYTDEVIRRKVGKTAKAEGTA
ncbi:50S ribosomal protein L6 [Patescibacteria group bacterium]|nr:50S ribosomal protein L6 [Patescibacteria group bacterium]